MQYSTKYIFGFAAAVCFFCSMMISISAVGLRDRQEANRQLDKQKGVLQACWILPPGGKMSREEIEKSFEDIETVVIDLATGEYVDAADHDAETFVPAPPNTAQVREVPKHMQVFQVMEGGDIKTLVLPIEGKGLWSTLKGYLALDVDTTTIRGLTYYSHGETPGLGGEVDNPRWKGLWPERRAFDDDWNVRIALLKGPAGPPEDDPFHVDGLSGATLTSRGVSNMLAFWLGDTGYGAYLEKLREGGSV